MIGIEENNPILQDKREVSHCADVPRRSRTYYEVLEVDPLAPREKIREAYMRLKNTYSSNSQAFYSVFGDDEAQWSLQEIEDAFRTLDDDMLRREYDQQQRGPAVEVGDPFVEEHSRPRDFIPNKCSSLTGMLSRSSGKAANRFAARAFLPEVQESIADILSSSDLGSGEQLKKIRKCNGVEVDEVSERTKISPEYVVAFENNDFQKLPALVYAKGFLKSYLTYLGVRDGKNMIDAFFERLRQWQNGKG